MNVSNKLVSIKKISGEVLLYFYWIQRQDISKLCDTSMSFQLRHFPIDKKNTGPELERRHETILNISELKLYSDGDLYNALNYLYDCGLINFNKSSTNVGDHILNIQLTASGVDIIEGIECGNTEQEYFNITFNFNVQNNITVESLLKAELGSLFKASLIG